MPRLHIKVPMQFSVKLSENNFYHHKSSFKEENIPKNVFSDYVCQSGPLNSLSNKLIKNFFFYNVLLIQLSFPTKIEY